MNIISMESVNRSLWYIDFGPRPVLKLDTEILVNEYHYEVGGGISAPHSMDTVLFCYQGFYENI